MGLPQEQYGTQVSDQSDRELTCVTWLCLMHLLLEIESMNKFLMCKNILIIVFVKDVKWSIGSKLKYF